VKTAAVEKIFIEINLVQSGIYTMLYSKIHVTVSTVQQTSLKEQQKIHREDFPTHIVLQE
jgi:hypothetical protein